MVIDLHNHTAEGSADSWIGGALLRARYDARADVDGFCVTEHLSRQNVAHLAAGGDGWSAVAKGVARGYRVASGGDGASIAFFGLEYRIEQDDFLVYGLDPDALGGLDFLLAFDWTALERLRSERPGIAVVQAHPFRKGCAPAPRSSIDAIEVYNGMFFHDAENAAAARWARETGLPAVGGTDCHEDDVGRMMTVFADRPRSNEDLATAIRAGGIAGFRIKDVARDQFIPYRSVYEEAA